MDKILLRKIILGGAFALALIIAIILASINHKDEITYTALGDSTLPIVSLKSNDKDINTLYGYRDAENAHEELESLTPLSENLKLPIVIHAFDNTVTGISYEVRTITGDDLLEKTIVDTWDNDGANVKATLPIKDILEEGREYRLVIVISTEKDSSVSYFTRIVKNNALRTTEMLDYISDFHASTFSVAEAEKYAVNWEVDGTADDQSLAFVDIHSSFNQLTYDELGASQVGDTHITILEMDETFGYFKICFEVKATGEDGEDTYYVEEFYSIQWSELRFYLMSYERHMVENFRANEANITNSKLYFGVMKEDDVNMIKSPEENYIAFSTNGDLWSYSSNNKEINEIFSFTSGQDVLRRTNHNYGIKIISADDEGNIDFCVYGYMIRGAHEGENGISYYRYNRGENTLNEKLFIRTTLGSEVIGKDLDTLCKEVGGSIYLLFDDSAYKINKEENETVKLIEGAKEHGFKVNEEQTAIAWAQGDDEKYPDQVQVRYLDSDKSNSILSKSGEYIKPAGFIEQDLAVIRADIADVTISGLQRVYPGSSLDIVDIDGKVVKSYEEPGSFITKAAVGEGKIVLERAKKETFEKISPYTIMQNDRELSGGDSAIKNEVLDKKERTYYTDNKRGAKKSDCNTYQPEQVSYYEGNMPSAQAGATQFYAYKSGHIVGIYDTAGEAIVSIKNDFSYVVSNKGHHIWHRKGKGILNYQMDVPSQESSQSSIAAALNVILAKEKLEANAEELLSNGQSAEEIIEAAKIGSTLVLNDCTMKELFVLLEKQFPIIALDKDDNAYLLVGHDEFNINVYNLRSGKIEKKGIMDSSSLFEAGGWRALSYFG